jgi:predicted nucleic acid-binding protein
LIALLDNRDDLYQRARAWDRTVTEKLIVTDYVLLEAVNHFSRPGSRAKVHNMLEFIRAADEYLVLPASAELFEAGLNLHRQRPDQEWSLTDCISFNVMGERQITLAFDHHFEQAGFRALLRSDPPSGPIR